MERNTFEKRVADEVKSTLSPDLKDLKNELGKIVQIVEGISIEPPTENSEQQLFSNGIEIISATEACSEKYLNCDKDTLVRKEKREGFPLRVQPHKPGQIIFYYLDDILKLMTYFKGRKKSK